MRGIIRAANPAAAALLGLGKPGDLIGQDLLELVAPAQRADALAVFQAALDAGPIRDQVFTLCRPTGERIEAQPSVAAVRARLGAAADLIVVARDVTEARSDLMNIYPSLQRCPRRRRLTAALLWLALSLTLVNCVAPASPPSPTPAPVRELRLYNWVDYMPPAVLEAFESEFGVTVVQEYFDTVEDAVANIRAGHRFDVAVVDHDYIPSLVAAGRLAELDHRNLPNLINIAASFRDLATDPDNRYSVPYTWGTTGLVARSDLTPFTVTRWSDLWDPRLAGRLVAREQPTELISVALKASGFDLNSEAPDQLEVALARLIELKPQLLLVNSDPANGIEPLLTGERWVLVGWGGDAITARQTEPAVTYRLPQEGTFLWSDAFVIAADSPARLTAEAFINFVLRPEISAVIVHAYGYPTANEMARPLLQPEYRDNLIIFPPLADLAGAEWYLPLSRDGEALYNAIWARFLAAP